MTKKRGNNHKNNTIVDDERDDEPFNDPTRLKAVDELMNVQEMEIPRLPSTQRAETFGLRASCGAELLSFSAVDEDYL